MRANVAWRTCRSRACWRALSTIREERSTPTTLPFGPTAAAAASDTMPVPQATSSTASPGTSAALAITRACIGESCACHSAA